MKLIISLIILVVLGIFTTVNILAWSGRLKVVDWQPLVYQYRTASDGVPMVTTAGYLFVIDDEFKGVSCYVFANTQTAEQSNMSCIDN